MAPAQFPFTFVVRKASGLELWYFRHRSFSKPRRIPGEPGHPEFHRVYSALLAEAKGEQQVAMERADKRSVRWLVEQYQASDEWTELSDASRRDYSRQLDRLCELGGDLAFAEMTKRGVLALRTRVKADVATSRQLALAKREQQDRARVEAGKEVITKRALPKITSGSRTADYFVAVLSALYSWAIEHEELPAHTTNPAAKTKKLRKKSSVEGHRPWTEEQIIAVLEKAPRAIYDGVIVGLYTGQRLKNCVRMTTEDIVHPVVRIRQYKTGNLVDVRATGPLLELVTRRKSAGDECSNIVIRDNGTPFSERLFSEHLRKFLDSLGFKDISFHGLRYAAAGTLNEAGATISTIISILGHSTYEMAIKYLSAREDQKRAAEFMEQAADRRSSGGTPTAPP